MDNVATWELAISWAVITVVAWIGLIKFAIYCIKHH